MTSATSSTPLAVAETTMKRSCRESSLELVLLGALFLTGCSSDATSSEGGGTGGATSAGYGGYGTSGGSPGSGDASNAGASGGGAGAGGNASATGGTNGAGGVAQTNGGVPGTGGDGLGGADVGAGGVPSGSGGAPGDGGAGSSGGAAGSGGSAGTGGAPPAKFCGNITTQGKVRSDFATYWDQITPENEGKWGSVEGTRNQMNWKGLDAVHDYAVQHGIPFKQHNFVWGNQQPGWIGSLSQADQRAEVEEWIRLFCERYPDTQMIDVVNEPPPHTTPSYTAALGGAGASGYDWIVQAFQWAHQYCPNSILILNDYNTIEYGNDNSHFIDIVQRIQKAGAPIHAIGAQAHAAFNVPTDTVKGYIDALASSTGLPVYISEYDINVADDGQQKNVMESQFTMFWTDPNVKGVTLWGYVEGATWLTNTGLISSAGQERPAMTWLMQYLNR
ncbi:MAG TPA: endo-1,4-beta-xylanase [Polyangiaceae bacterium]|nr:endo-1,4-beta-xylanase [Polyangiaceae bacterium]